MPKIAAEKKCRNSPKSSADERQALDPAAENADREPDEVIAEDRFVDDRHADE